MTEQEAIKELKEWCVMECGKENIIECVNCEMQCNTKDVILLAIKALKKQIPQKAKFKGKFIGRYECKCGAIVNETFNYCYECGQKLK